MLEVDDQEPIATTEVLPCQVALPEDWSDFFDRRGPLPAAATDVRRFARQFFRTRVVIRLLNTLPAFERDEQPIATLGKDISRSGISLLSHVQLFPGESGELQTPGRWLPFEVVRCRKHGEACYEIGAVTLKD